MAAACLREDCWTVHHLAADMPAEELARFTAEVGATLVVLSTVTSAARVAARQAASRIAVARPAVTVLVGEPGDCLRDLSRRAAAAGAPAGSTG